jgi:hypothetical protein
MPIACRIARRSGRSASRMVCMRYGRVDPRPALPNVGRVGDAADAAIKTVFNPAAYSSKQDVSCLAPCSRRWGRIRALSRSLLAAFGRTRRSDPGDEPFLRRRLPQVSPLYTPQRYTLKTNHSRGKACHQSEILSWNAPRALKFIEQCGRFCDWNTPARR